jgi:hypothetical protein
LGNADLPFTVAFGLGAIAVCKWIETSSARWLISAGFALGVGAWLKLDGIYLGLVGLVVAGLAQLVFEPQARKTVLLHTACGIALLIALYAPWHAYRMAQHIAGETPGLAMLGITGATNLRIGSAVLIEEMIFSHNNSTWGLLGGGYNLLWPVCLGILAFNLRRVRHDTILAFLVATLLAAIVFYLAIYLVRPFYSMERYLMHIAPLAVLAAARATGAPWPAISSSSSAHSTNRPALAM